MHEAWLLRLKLQQHPASFILLLLLLVGTRVASGSEWAMRYERSDTQHKNVECSTAFVADKKP